MKISFFDATPKWSGGAGRIYFLSNELKSKGHEVHVICLHGSDLSKKLKEEGVNCFEVKPLSDVGLLSFIKILKYLAKNSIDIIDINSPMFYWTALYAAKCLKIKVVITRNVPYRKRGLKKLINKHFLYNLCDAVISLSEKVKSELVEDYGLKNIRVIYDGILNEPKVYSPDEIESFRNKHHIGKDIVLFGSIGRLEESKGQIYAIESFKKIKDKIPNSRFILVGSGDKIYEKKCRDKIKELNLEESVTILGFVEEISKIYASIDILIHPSLYDNIPFSILEAFSYKKAVSASRVGGIPEIIEDGVNGMLFESGNVQDMADKTIKLATADFREFGKRGFEIIQNKFSKKTMIDNYINLMNELTLK